MMENWGYYPGQQTHPALMWLSVVSFVLLVVVAAFIWVRYVGNLRGPRSPERRFVHRYDQQHGHYDHPIEILKIRFAKGKIDEAEFNKRRAVLEALDHQH